MDKGVIRLNIATAKEKKMEHVLNTKIPGRNGSMLKTTHRAFEYTMADAMDSINTLVNKCGVELDFYSWKMITDQMEEPVEAKQSKDSICQCERKEYWSQFHTQNGVGTKIVPITCCSECPHIWRYLGLDEHCNLMDRRPIPIDDKPFPEWCPLPNVQRAQ